MCLWIGKRLYYQLKDNGLRHTCTHVKIRNPHEHFQHFHRAGLFGSNKLEGFLIDEWLETLTEIINKQLRPIKLEQDEAKKVEWCTVSKVTDRFVSVNGYKNSYNTQLNV